MISVSLEVRGGDECFEVTARADSISEAVGGAERRFPGSAVRVVFPIDGHEFFRGEGADDRPALVLDQAR